MQLEPLAEPHLSLPAPPANDRNVDREYDESERYHPEADDGEEAEKPEQDQQHADRNPHHPVFRQIEFSVPKLDCRHGLSNIGSSHHPQGRELEKPLRRHTHFDICKADDPR